MIGGGTVLRTGCGKIMKVRGQQMGRYIELQGLGPSGRWRRSSGRAVRGCDDTVLPPHLFLEVSSRYSFFGKQERLLAHMNQGIVDAGDIVMGSIDDTHLLTRGAATADDAKV
ncbi:hypothetical protein DL764_001773 [Monosporascus ibericus]|uniref:Uncharacterized protein n=1 Tax=Monosporascus ibericus TaxID=155417 RepID=A0A4Q4TN75_9PEZI|nr:hypothetical protein DL764_001773 [Monosporascus ibericus]